MSAEQNPPESINHPNPSTATQRSKSRRGRRTPSSFQLPASMMAKLQRDMRQFTEPAGLEMMRSLRRAMDSVTPPASIIQMPSLPATSLPITSLAHKQASQLAASLPQLHLTAVTQQAWSSMLQRSGGFLNQNTLFANGLDMSGWLPTSAQLNIMVPRIDLGHADEIAAIIKHLQPTLMASTQTTLATLAQSISELLGNWSILTTIGHRLAERGLQAAKVARAAAIRGERKAVADFARTWLGIAKALDWIVDAVIGALLENGWLDLADEDPATALDTLRKETTAQRRGTQTLWDRKVRHHHIALLDEPLTTSMTRADLLVGPDVRAFGEFDDPRVLTVLANLTESEKQIALAYSQTASWDEAAAYCDTTPEQAESVRRKLKYRGKQLRQVAPPTSADDAA